MIVTSPRSLSLQGEVVHIHAKMIVADRSKAFVGSENFSRASLDDNRELGLTVTDPAVVGPAAATFAEDFAAAQPWAG
jgi:cardiolipin synthase A/B